MPQGTPKHVPDDGLTTRQRRNRALVIVHTGPGKGKSTAAFGLALRAWNQGWPIGVFQFVKSAKWRVGEERALRVLGETGQGGAVSWHKMGEGWSWVQRDNEDHALFSHGAEQAAEGWAQIKRDLAARTYRLYVLDEFTYPMKWAWVDAAEVIETLATRPTPPAARRYDAPAAEALPRAFGECDASVSFLAVGATVRLLAPLLTSKTEDPAVVCVDENLRYAVPVLGAHQGGGNDLARRVAAILGAEPVVTTASDAGGRRRARRVRRRPRLHRRAGQRPGRRGRRDPVRRPRHLQLRPELADPRPAPRRRAHRPPRARRPRRRGDRPENQYERTGRRLPPPFPARGRGR